MTPALLAWAVMLWDALAPVARSYAMVGPVAGWLTAPLGAAIAYRQHHPAGRTLRSFLGFCFPRDLVRHPSARLDLAFNIANFLLHPLFLLPAVAGTAAVAEGCYGGLAALFGTRPQSDIGLPGWLAMLLASVLLQDAISFHVHYLQHRVRMLWSFHKVHHSLEYMVPVLSGRRDHPLEELMGTLLQALGIGVATAAGCYLFGLRPLDGLVAGADAYVLLNTLSFFHLRHSHIPLRYGWLERYLLSPAQHHIHHSREPEHWDRNFGWLFSVWDRMYGTIVYSETAPQRFRIGLQPDDQPRYDRVWKLYLMPLWEIALMLRGAARNGGPAPPAGPGT